MIYPQATAPLAVTNPLFGLGIGLGVASSLVGASYSRIIGTFAHPRTATSTLLTQLTTLETQRLANVPITATTDIYFAAAGNDVSGDGSQGNPYKSLDKFHTICAANTSGASIRFRFNKGDRFYLTNSDDYNQLYPGMRMDAYGTGAAPILSAFSIQFNNVTSWTSTGAGAYYATSATQVTWLKLADPTNGIDTTKVLIKALSVAECQAKDNSFYYDSGASRIYIRYGANVNPNGTAFEAVKGLPVTNAQFLVLGTNMRIEGIRFEGFGVQDDAHYNIQCYGVKLENTLVTDELVAKDCQFYYTGYHAMGAIGPGKFTFKSCTGGLVRPQSRAFCTVGVGYADTGLQEVLWLDCTIHSGNLFESTGSGYTTRLAQTIYGHIGSGSVTNALAVVRNLTVTAGPMSAYQTAALVDVPSCVASPVDATNEVNIRAARGFIIGEVLNESAAARYIKLGAEATGYGGVVRINCRYQGFPATGINSFGSPGDGWWLNCILSSDNGDAGALDVVLPDTGSSPRFTNCHFETQNAGCIFGHSYNAALWANLTVENSILSGTYYYPVTPGLYLSSTSVNISVTAGNVRNCLVGSVQPCVPFIQYTPAGTAGDGTIPTSAPHNNVVRVITTPASGGKFNNKPAILAAPTSGDTDLYNVGNATTQCELDYNGVTRGSRKTLGPVNGT